MANCTHHHANPPKGTQVHCVRCDQAGRTKLMLKFATAAHQAGITNLWEAQELISIDGLTALMATHSKDAEFWWEEYQYAVKRAERAEAALKVGTL